jgi:serine/threonine protein kinase
MLDAARAVAYIHSFSPAFIHRDIKPGNFLVDAEFNVKLTDFGESRSLPRSQRPQDEVLSGGFINNGQRVPTATRMTVRGTVDYMAPEIINGKAGLATYGEAADVYSLAITMWDILHPGREKFPTLRNNHLQVFDHVVEGNRPEFNEDLHPSLREVIESAWSPHAHLRPSAQNIVSILESIQEEMFAAFALQLSSSLDQRVAANNKYGNTIENSFTGAHAIEKMEELYYIHSPGEGIRLGNALMDAGLVHHLKHSRSFEYGSQLYYFDEENIHLCQPLDLSEQSNVYMDANSVGTVSSSHASTAASATVSVFSRFSKRSRRRGAGSTGTSDWGARSGSTRSDQLFLENGMCTCRKLGQRIYHPKVMRRRFRRKFKAIAEENVLTTNLLQEESNNDFEEFDAVTINVAA